MGSFDVGCSGKHWGSQGGPPEPAKHRKWACEGHSLPDWQKRSRRNQANNMHLPGQNVGGKPLLRRLPCPCCRRKRASPSARCSAYVGAHVWQISIDKPPGLSASSDVQGASCVLHGCLHCMNQGWLDDPPSASRLWPPAERLRCELKLRRRKLIPTSSPSHAYISHKTSPELGITPTLHLLGDLLTYGYA